MDLKVTANKEVSPKLSSLQSATAGAISSLITRAILQPFDVLKIRFQLQVESTKQNRGGLYQGIFQATKTIIRNEGVYAMWKGHVPAQVLSITYGAGQFWSFTFFKRQAEDWGYENDGRILSVCGGLAGLVGTLVSFPFDLARTRIVAQSRQEFTGMMDVWKRDLARENFFSLWKGLTPTLLMTVPFAAIQFRMYYFLSNMIPTGTVEGFKDMGVEVSRPAVCGAIAGLSAKLVVYPLDVLKKRMQIKGSEKVREGFGKVVVYRNMWDCIRRIMMEEGPVAWFKGLKPSLIKSASFSGVLFSLYEISCNAILTLDLYIKDGR